ncbi:MAG: prepilin-type N-terminal cleavage/methylation domain-containing protein [Candidatus Saccharibacteria bacterium]|nr:prepilin-type N-terminal cleavage/methylation domain-containing protein [Candidatus Saccharibacteria bacterium]
MSLKRITQAGDTLIEVLVSLAAVSLLLGGAIATSSQSQRGSLRSQERSEATKVAEAQVEHLRATPYKTIDTNVLFHFGTAGNLVSGAGSVSGAGGTGYAVQITRPDASDHTFTVTVSWTPAGGGPSNNVIMKYAVY